MQMAEKMCFTCELYRKCDSDGRTYNEGCDKWVEQDLKRLAFIDSLYYTVRSKRRKLLHLRKRFGVFITKSITNTVTKEIANEDIK